MNTKALNELAALICRAQEQDRTPMGIAFAIDAAGRHMSPETAAEMAALRDRVDEVERQYTFDVAELRRERDALLAERHTTNEALDDAVQALRAGRPPVAVVVPTFGDAGDVTPQVTKLRSLLAGQREAVDGEHYAVVHHAYRVPRDLPPLGGQR